MKQRLESIDVLRGFDMLFIMGFSTVVLRLCDVLGWGAHCWLAEQMRHPPWMGLTHHDTIFPLFIFIAGLSFPFSKAKQLANGRTKAQILWRVLRRSAMLVLLGMVYEKFFQGQPFRFGSVLGRIGITWALAAWMYVALGVRTRLAIAALLLLGYWALNLFLVAPDNPTAGVFTPQGNIGCWIDRTVLAPLGRISPGTEELPFENQSLLGNITATAMSMFGMFIGEFVRAMRGRWSGNRQAGVLAIAAVALTALGYFVAYGCGRWSFPLSKPLFSTSFTLVVGGYSVAMFTLFYWLIDVKGWWRRTMFFRVIGMNAITVYMLQRVFDMRYTSDILFGRIAAMFPVPWITVASAVAYVLTCWIFLFFLYRKNVFLKV